MLTATFSIMDKPTQSIADYIYSEGGQRPMVKKIGQLAVIVSQDPTVERGIERLRWHLSISHASRYPTWDEIKDARYKYLPAEITVAMILPPPGEYVNVHPNCFHLHEIPSEKEWARP